MHAFIHTSIYAYLCSFNFILAINDSCLVFDGKLVIDSKFHTNDLQIRAAGPLTKYALRYYTKNWTHANYNSKEVGTKLAESVLELFDPTLHVLVIDDDDLVPKYKEPKSTLCNLPGNSSFILYLCCFITYSVVVQQNIFS